MNKKELEEAAERYIAEDNNNRYYNDFIEGAKWMQERMYSEEDMRKYASYFFRHSKYISPKDWFEQNKKK
jgi:hypothetical protein